MKLAKVVPFFLLGILVSACVDRAPDEVAAVSPENADTKTVESERARLKAVFHTMGTPIQFTSKDYMYVGADDVLSVLKKIREKKPYYSKHENPRDFAIALSLTTQKGELTAYLQPLYLTSLDMQTGAGFMDVTLPEGGDPAGLLAGNITTGDGDITLHVGSERAILVNIKSQGAGEVKFVGPVLRDGPFRADFDVVLGKGNLIINAN